LFYNKTVFACYCASFPVAMGKTQTKVIAEFHCEGSLMLPIVYSSIALKLDTCLRTGAIDGRLPPLRQLAAANNCSLQTLCNALVPFRRCGAIFSQNARVLRVDASKLPTYSIAIVGDFTPSPHYDDSSSQMMYSTIRKHGGKIALLSVSGGRICRERYSMLTGFDGVIFTSPTHLTPDLCSFLNHSNVRFVSDGSQPGCDIADWVGHETFSMHAKLLRQCVSSGYREIELCYPAVQYNEYETRQRRWCMLKKRLGLPILSGDKIVYDSRRSQRDNLRFYLEMHNRLNDWPQVIIFYPDITFAAGAPFAAMQELLSLIPPSVLCLSSNLDEAPFCRYQVKGFSISKEYKLLAESLIRRLLFPNHPPIRTTLQLTADCKIANKKETKK
jgi:DNA-binding LacI/PurR family transcriptional regulator